MAECIGTRTSVNRLGKTIAVLTHSRQPPLQIVFLATVKGLRGGKPTVDHLDRHALASHAIFPGTADSTWRSHAAPQTQGALAWAFACHRFSVVLAPADRVKIRWHVAGRPAEFSCEDIAVRWPVDKNENEKRIFPVPKKADQDCALQPRRHPSMMRKTTYCAEARYRSTRGRQAVRYRCSRFTTTLDLAASHRRFPKSYGPNRSTAQRAF